MGSDDKIINLFNNKKDKEPQKVKESAEGSKEFHFVKMEKDAYGRAFMQESLEKFAKSCHYIIRVMKTLDKKVFLYDYEVPPERLYEFLSDIETHKIDGKVIEIEKYFP